MSKIRVVVIDDEHFNRGLITLLIRRFRPDFEIAAEADSVRDGWKAIREQRPDVVFLDIKMPDGSGFDLLKMFKVVPFETIFVTGFDEFQQNASELNAIDYVLKPIDLDKFQQALSNVEQKVIEKRNHRI
jgi:two-component system, LytTR family, response regulator